MQVRVKLYILSFTGFMVNYMLRTDLNIAVLAMAKHNTTELTPSLNISYPPPKVRRHNNSPRSLSSHEIGEFEWTPAEQNHLQTGFYWWYFISSGISGIFINRWGPTKTFGYGQFVSGFGSLLIPFFAADNYIYVFILRSLQGFAEGVTWPAFYALVGRWIPPYERNRFLSATYGYFLGIGLSYVAFGFVISYFGWRTVFYLTGIINTVWCALWLWNAYDDPEEHPSISDAELKLIQSKRQDVAPRDQALETPWRDIFASPVFWSISISNFGRFWIMSVIFLYAPLYLKNIVNIEIDKNGVFSGLPYIIACCFCLPVSSLADYVVKKKILSTLRIRLLFTMMSQVFTGLLLMLVIFTQTAWEFTLLCTVLLISFSFSSSGSAASIVDIAPNFAGPTWAVAQLVFMSANFLCPVLVNYLIVDSNNPDQWLTLFQLSTAIGVVTFIPYLIFATDKVQYWNDKGTTNTQLRKKPDIIV